MGGGKQRTFFDGCGLCSAGRWKPEQRRSDPTPLGKCLRQRLLGILLRDLDIAKTIVLLACGRCTKCPIPDETVRDGRAAWIELLKRFRLTNPSPDVSDQMLEEVTLYQPYFLYAIGEHLRLIGDPDWRVFYQRRFSFTRGINLGIKEPLPRNPAVFERRCKVGKYDDNDGQAPETKNNYKSVRGQEEKLRKQFEEERDLGMMYSITRAAAREKFGDNFVTAALGALAKDDDRVRVLFDATHGVRSNPAVQQRDQLHTPGARDARAEVAYWHDVGVKPFSLKGDVEKAHRRYLVHEDDHEHQLCTLDDGEDEVWVNRVGTFGFVPAALWFARVQGGVARAALTLVLQCMFFQALYADDYRWTSGGIDAIPNLLLVIFFTVMAGTPLLVEKVRRWHQHRLGRNLFRVSVFLAWNHCI